MAAEFIYNLGEDSDGVPIVIKTQIERLGDDGVQHIFSSYKDALTALNQIKEIFKSGFLSHHEATEEVASAIDNMTLLDGETSFVLSNQQTKILVHEDNRQIKPNREEKAPAKTSSINLNLNSEEAKAKGTDKALREMEVAIALGRPIHIPRPSSAPLTSQEFKGFAHDNDTSSDELLAKALQEIDYDSSPITSSPIRNYGTTGSSTIFTSSTSTPSTTNTLSAPLLNPTPEQPQGEGDGCCSRCVIS